MKYTNRKRACPTPKKKKYSPSKVWAAFNSRNSTYPYICVCGSYHFATYLILKEVREKAIKRL